MATYNRSSPYYATGEFGQFLDLLEYRDIPQNQNDVEYQIDPVYEYRPDLLAYDLYQNAGLWWVFAVRNPNILKDPLFDFSAGKIIFIPTKETLTASLGL